MESRLLKFARIVDVGSFTKAASILHISQPALTATVKKLEKELRAELLVRGSRTLTLTPAGHAAYQTAKDLHILSNNLRTRLAAITKQKILFRLGVIDAIADLLFVHGNYLKELDEQTRLSLSIDRSSHLMKLTRTGELDLSLVAKPDNLAGTLTGIPLGQEPLVLVSAKQYLARALDGLAQGTLEQFLAYNQNSRTYRLIAAHFAAAGIELKPVFYSTSPEIMLQLVQAGRGVAVLPYLLVRPSLEAQTLVPVNIDNSPLITRDIIALYRTGSLLPVQADRLLMHTKTALATLYAEATELLKQ